MKKAIAGMLCILLLLATMPGAAAQSAPTTQTAPVKIRQYGEEDSLVSDSDGLVGEIAYPVGNIEDIDSAILTWASVTMQQWRKDATGYVPQSNNTGYVGYAHTKYFNIATPDVPPAQQRNPKTVIEIA